METAELSKIYERLSGMTPWEALTETALRLPQKTALVCGGRRLTYAELKDETERLSEGLIRAGFKRGDVAAIYMKNSVEFIEVFYALQRIGVVVAWLNPNYRETEARFILGNSGAKAVFVFEEWQGFNYLSAVKSLKPELPRLERIILADGKTDACDDFITPFNSLYADKAGDAPEKPGPSDLSMLIYTSGTTGKPKGAMINQSQAVRAGYSYSLGVDATEDDIFIAFLPMAHSYGCGSLLLQPFILGATVVVMDAFNPVKAFELIEREKVTVQLAGPAHYIMELASPERGKYNLKSLRAGLIAGQIAPEGLITRVEKEMGVHIASFLGSSEVGPGLSIILPFDTDLKTREQYIGYPVYGTSIRIIDPETGADRNDGEPGELLLTGWHLMSGYWENLQETANQLKNGWLHTGDLVKRNGDGPVQILGRIKECINRGGLKIIPSELEGLIIKHPGVAEVAVVGTSNPVLGESICVCVKAAPGEKAPTLSETREFLEGKVAPYKLPDELLVMDEFPRLGGGLKINRFGVGGLVELASTSTQKEKHRK